MQRASPALLAEQASGYFGAKSQSSVSVWLYSSAEQTLADWNSHLGSHQLKQAWPQLSIDLLGAEVLCLPRPGCGKQDPSHYLPGLGSSRAVPTWLFHLHLGSLVVW